MEFHILLPLILTLVSVVVLLSPPLSDAAPAPKLYWKKVLPNTPMPNAIIHSLHPESEIILMGDDKSTSPVSVGRRGAGVLTKDGTIDNPDGGDTGVQVGKGGVTVGTRTKKGKPVYVGVYPGPNPFVYIYASTQTQLESDPARALFFLQQDLTKGTQMSLQFTTTTAYDAVFLPRSTADSIPFSSDKLPAILDRFSVDPSSDEAAIMGQTIKDCETKAINGEDKFCATSLESMVDYVYAVSSKLGTTRNEVRAVSTDATGDHLQGVKKTYTITGARRIGGGAGDVPVVVCHKMRYPYAVFYCHRTATTEAYTVELEAAEGKAVIKAAAVCHEDTAGWNPKHLAFQVLKVKPGSVPVCHFLPEDHVLWVRGKQ